MTGRPRDARRRQPGARARHAPPSPHGDPGAIVSTAPAAAALRASLRLDRRRAAVRVGQRPLAPPRSPALCPRGASAHSCPRF